jgi:hypothetical protein
MSNFLPADVTFYKETTGTAKAPDTNGDATLVLAETYYADVGNAQFHKSSVMFSWDASIIITGITYEFSNFPDAGLYLPAGKIWKDSGVAATTVAGGSASSVIAHFADNMAGRMRAKIIVGATGGKLRCRPHFKRG